MRHFPAQGSTRFTRHDVRSEDGFSLIELMVAIVVAAIVGGLIVAVIANANTSTRSVSASVMTESQMVDAMTRLGRDINGASSVVSATETSIELRDVSSSACIDNKYAAANGTLVDQTTVLTSATCPLVGGTVSSTHSTTVISGMTTNTLFTYFSSSNVQYTPVPGMSQIARVSYTVTATVAGRSNPLTLTSSANPSSSRSSVIGSGTATCPAPVLSGALSGQTETLTWSQPVSATGYRLMRDGVVIALIPSGSTTTFADRGIAWGGTHLYYVNGICGLSTSPNSNGVIVTLPPPAPVLTGTLVASGGQANPDNAALSWTSVAGAITYTLYGRDVTAGGAYAVLDGPNADLAFTQSALTYDDTYSYYVQAINTAGSSPQSNIVTVTPSYTCENTGAPLLTVTVNVNDASVHLTWSWATQPAGSTPSFNIGSGTGGLSATGIYGNAYVFANVNPSTLALTLTAQWGPHGKCDSPEALAVVTVSLASPILTMNVTTGVDPNMINGTGTHDCLLSWVWPNGGSAPAWVNGYAILSTKTTTPGSSSDHTAQQVGSILGPQTTGTTIASSIAGDCTDGSNQGYQLAPVENGTNIPIGYGPLSDAVGQDIPLLAPVASSSTNLLLGTLGFQTGTNNSTVHLSLSKVIAGLKIPILSTVIPAGMPIQLPTLLFGLSYLITATTSVVYPDGTVGTSPPTTLSWLQTL